MNFITNAIGNWKMVWIAGGQTLREVKIQRHLPGRLVSPLQLVIAMMPLDHVLRTCTGDHKLSTSEEKMYPRIDKGICKNEEIEFLSYFQMVCAQTRIRPRKRYTKHSLGF